MKDHSGLETWLLMPCPHRMGAQDSCIKFRPSWTHSCGLTAYSGGIHFIWSPSILKTAAKRWCPLFRGESTEAYWKREGHVPGCGAGKAKPGRCVDPPGTLTVRWVTRERLGKREDPGCLYTFPTLFPDGSATSTQATAAISTCWSPATSDTGMSGAPFSHRCRLYAACGTASGIMRAASRCWPQSLLSEPSCTPPR